MTNVYAGKVTIPPPLGVKAAGLRVRVYNHGTTTLATSLYADRVRTSVTVNTAAAGIPSGVPAGNVGVDSSGTVVLFGEPTLSYDVNYLLAAGASIVVRVTPPVDPAEPFFAIPAAEKPVLTYAKASETAADTQLRVALVSLGLVVDSTV
jgi:hypothetical protein